MSQAPGGGRAGGAGWSALAAAVRLAWQAGPGYPAGQFALAVLGGAAPVLAGWLTKIIVDRLTGVGPTGGLVGPAVGLALAGVVVATGPHLVGHLESAWARSATLLAQSRLSAAVNRLTGLARLEDPTFADQLRLAEQAGRSAPVTVTSGALELFRALVTTSGFALTLAGLNGWMVAAVLLAAVPTGWIELVLARQRATALWRISPGTRRQLFYSQLLTGLDAAKEIRLFGLADLFRGRMLGELRTINAATGRLEHRQLLAHAGLALGGALVAGTGLVWAITEAQAGRLTAGDVTVFVAAVAAVQGAVASSTGRLAGIREALLLFGHFDRIVTAGPDLPTAGDPQPVRPLRGAIVLSDVWFRYGPEQPWILRGVDLTIPFGQTLALVGVNGAGKSTLVKLLLRFYDPTRGSIHWDGTDLREVPVGQLRERISAVFQDYMCYDLTAGENIALGDLTAGSDPARITAAAHAAGAHEVLAGLPRGYSTPLTRLFLDHDDAADTDTGVLLSGGQWQRVALARSFLRADRDLLILDEPSAGLDAAAEHDVHTRLRRLRQGRTTLMITHRLGTVREADQIIVLADGRVTETGNHDDLLALDGEYARLFRLQARGYATPTPGDVPTPAVVR